LRYTFKLIIAGDGGVGKTTLVDRYVNGTFHSDSRITIGVGFMVKRLVVDGNPIDLQIWDFGGEDRFRFLLPSYCRGAHGAIFMYDTTNPPSLCHVNEWMQLLRATGGKFPVIMGGTKADLVNNRKVPAEEATATARKFGLIGIAEVSSKTGLNVDALFSALCRKMIETTRPAITAPTRAPVTQMASVPARI